MAKNTKALTDELARVLSDIATAEGASDSAQEVAELKREIEALKIEKARLVEDNDRKIRETEHKVGLLKTKQDQDVSHATRLAKLEVRESNLDADKDRFEKEMTFQREHLQREVDRIENILGKVLDRLPDVTASLRFERASDE